MRSGSWGRRGSKYEKKNTFLLHRVRNETPKWQGNAHLRRVEHHCGASGGEGRQKELRSQPGQRPGVAVNRPRTMAEVETTDELRMGELTGSGATAGAGSLVLVGGAPWIGKSRTGPGSGAAAGGLRGEGSISSETGAGGGGRCAGIGKSMALMPRSVTSCAGLIGPL